jgi:hypothetical protein
MSLYLNFFKKNINIKVVFDMVWRI